MQGFSLLELILVVSLFGMVAVGLYPLSLGLYQKQILGEVHDGLRSSLRTAQVSALTQKHDSAQGVKILNDSYVLFTGSSYASRDPVYDLVHLVPSTVNLTGSDEVVFNQRTGMPTATGTIALSLNNLEAEIHVREQGLVE